VPRSVQNRSASNGCPGSWQGKAHHSPELLCALYTVIDSFIIAILYQFSSSLHKTTPARSSDGHALIAGRCAPWKVASPSESLVLQALHLQRRAAPPNCQSGQTYVITHLLSALCTASLTLAVNRSLDSDGLDGPKPVCRGQLKCDDMAHAQKPDFVFRRNVRVHLNRRGLQFSRLLAAEVCASAVVMLDTPCSEVV
jgi:hypothetical protein